MECGGVNERRGWDSHPAPAPTFCDESRCHFFFGGGAGFAVDAFAFFFGFFFSLLCELLPLPIMHSSNRKLNRSGTTSLMLVHQGRRVTHSPIPNASLLPAIIQVSPATNAQRIQATKRNAAR